MLQRRMPWTFRPPALANTDPSWQVVIDNADKAKARVNGELVARGAMSASHGITSVGPAILAGNRSGSAITMGQVSIPSWKPVNGCTFVALLAMNAPAVASNLALFISAGGSGTDYGISFTETASYNRIAIAARNNYSSVLSVVYDFTTAMPFGLLQIDFDGTTARILWNGQVLVSGTKTGAIPAAFSPAVVSPDLGAGYQTTPAIAFFAYKDSFDGRVLSSPYEIFVP